MSILVPRALKTVAKVILDAGLPLVIELSKKDVIIGSRNVG